MKNVKYIIIGAVIAALIQTGLLAKIIYDRGQHLQHGKEVLLQTGMVDPRDLFRGHYVRLNLSIGRILGKDVNTIGELKYGKSVFVLLKKGDAEFWIPDAIYADLPEASDNPVLKGKLTYIRNSKDPEKATYQISFPFDRYFAPKKRAKELEKIRNDRQLGIIVALNDKGEGLIKGISVEGKSIYNEPIY